MKLHEPTPRQTATSPSATQRALAPRASLRALGKRIRSVARRSSAPATGVTLAGGDSLEEAISAHAIPVHSMDGSANGDHRETPLLGTLASASHDTAPPDLNADRTHAMVGWRFAPGQPPTQLLTDELDALLSDTRGAPDSEPDSTLQRHAPPSAEALVEAPAVDESGAPSGARFLWIDVTNYTADELSQVARRFDVNRRAIHVALAPWQRPRLTVFPSHFFMSATIPYLAPDSYRIHLGELDLFVGGAFVISAHKASLPFREQVEARARNSAELADRDPMFLLYIILDALVSYYEELNRHVQAEIERLEERALHDSSSTFLEDLVRFKRYTFALSQLADQHRDVFLVFIRPDFPWTAGRDDLDESFADLHERLTRLTDILLDAREAVNGAFDIYVSHQSHRTNQIIRLLTIVSIVLFTASIVVSVFGTTLLATVHNSVLSTPLGLLLMVVAIVAINAATLWFFRRRDWI